MILWQILVLRQQLVLRQPHRQPLGRHLDVPCHVPVAVAIERQHLEQARKQAEALRMA